MGIREYIWLFIMSWVAATISGTAGFGVSIILLPILTSIYGFLDTIPIITLAQLFSNASRGWFGRKDIVWKPIGVFLVGAIPFAIIGAFLFSWFNSNALIMLAGVFLIIEVVFRRLFPSEQMIGKRGLLYGGVASGFFAGIVGNGSPVSTAIFFGLNLSATAYIATEAVAGFAMNIVTTIIYKSFSILSLHHLWIGLYISVAIVLGSLSGRYIITHLNYKRFLLIVELLLAICGVLMIVGNFVDR